MVRTLLQSTANGKQRPQSKQDVSESWCWTGSCSQKAATANRKLIFGNTLTLSQPLLSTKVAAPVKTSTSQIIYGLVVQPLTQFDLEPHLFPWRQLPSPLGLISPAHTWRWRCRGRRGWEAEPGRTQPPSPRRRSGRWTGWACYSGQRSRWWTCCTSALAGEVLSAR